MSTSKPLRLLDFPSCVHRKILPQLAPIDCVELALQSSKFRRIIRNSKKIQATSLEWTFRGKMDITLMFGEKDQVTIIRPTGISLTQKKKFENPLTCSELRFERKKYSNDKYGDQRTLMPCQKICCNRTTLMPYWELVTTILMEFVNVDYYLLCLDNRRNIGLINCFVWNYTRNFRRIVFVCLWKIDCTKELDFLQNEITANFMRMRFDEESSKLQCKIPLKQKFLIIDDLKSYPIESILNMETQQLHLSCSGISCSDSNRIIKHWIEGGLEKLEKLYFFEWNFENSQDRKSLMDGIETVETREPRPDSLLQRFSRNEPFESTYDILREGDGKRATVGINGREFIFAVWPVSNGN